MVKKDLREMLVEGALELGVELDGAALGRFFQYLEELKAWSRRMNLTSITSDREIVIRHFLDSLAPYSLLTGFGCKSLLDIGSGAGFPGIPLKIAEPALRVVLMDSVQKKVYFMRHVIRKLGMNTLGIKVIAARAGDPSVIKELAGGGSAKGFDCVISRAFSGVEAFLGLAIPYCRKNGHVVAIKGPGLEKELEGFRTPQGVGPPEITRVKLPFSNRTTTLVSFSRSG